MILLRIVAPTSLAPTVLGYLEGLDDVCDVLTMPGAGRKPPGDLIQCTVPRESASAVIGVLRELGVAEQGSITLLTLDVAESAATDRVEEQADRSSADAVVWEEVEDRTETMAALSLAFLIYMMAATIIAAVGILTDSVVLIIGAMVVGPEFGPLAGVCVGVTRRRWEMVRQGAISLGVGFALAIAAAYLATKAFAAGGIAPGKLDASVHPETLFISRPDAYSVVIAALSGVAGMLSLTTASAGTLIGVLISVTTIPAAANMGVAASYRDWDSVAGAAAQLGINVVVLIAAGLITLRVQHLAFTRQLAGYVERLRHLRVRRRG